MTVAQVAQKLQVSTDWVRDHVTKRTPKLPAIRLGGKHYAMLRFRERDIDEFIDEQFTKTSKGQT